MIEIAELAWNEDNIEHIARHTVSEHEVEEVCQSNFYASDTYEGRIRVIGETRSGRTLTVILAPKGGGLYLFVTARPASKKERLKYQVYRGGEQAA